MNITYGEMKNHGVEKGILYGCQLCTKEHGMTALNFNDEAETLECPKHGVMWPKTLDKFLEPFLCETAVDGHRSIPQPLLSAMSTLINRRIDYCTSICPDDCAYLVSMVLMASDAGYLSAFRD